MIRAKFLKLSVNIIVGPLALMKMAVYSPVYKKRDPFNKEIYQQRKVIELQFLNMNFSDFLRAYRKHFSSQHALIRLIEEWKTSLEAKKHTAAVLIDLSKAFDSLPINLLIAKLAAHGVSINSLKLLQSYLTDRKQTVKSFDILVHGGHLIKVCLRAQYLDHCSSTSL